MMAVVSFLDAARRLRGGGDFFAPYEQADLTATTDWTGILQQIRKTAESCDEISVHLEHRARPEELKQLSLEGTRSAAL